MVHRYCAGIKKRGGELAINIDKDVLHILHGERCLENILHLCFCGDVNVCMYKHFSIKYMNSGYIWATL